PHRPVPDHGAGHQRQDAVDRAADGRRRPVRDRRRRQRAQARAAVPRGELPALGFAGRVPGPGRVAGAHQPALAEFGRAGAGPGAGPGQRPDPRREPLAGAPDRRARQPRQPFLPRPVLGPGAGRPGRACGPEGEVRAAGQGAVGERGADRGRAQRRAGPAGGHRRLLPPGHGKGVGGDAPEPAVQRGAGGAVAALGMRAPAQRRARLGGTFMMRPETMIRHPLFRAGLLAPTLAPALSTALAAEPAAAAQATASAVDPALEAVLAGDWRSEANRARDRYRHPAQTLAFFGLKPDQTVVEITPGGGWYAEILAPYLREHGRYVAAVVDPQALPEDRRDYPQRARAELEALFAGAPAQFDRAAVVAYDPAAPKFGEPGSADLVVTFRNVHNWRGSGQAHRMFEGFFEVLREGGVLGVVEHRAAADVAEEDRSGYVGQDQVIALAE